jgi:hypothetical protein
MIVELVVNTLLTFKTYWDRCKPRRGVGNNLKKLLKEMKLWIYKQLKIYSKSIILSIFFFFKFQKKY